MNEKVPEPEIPQTRGRVKLELTHPRTGKVLKSVEEENAIGDLWQLAARWYARQCFWKDSPGAPTYDLAPYSPATGHVGLFDSAANPGSLLFSGNTIAYATKATYAGPSTFQGTIVTTECQSGPQEAKYVWEWPTTAGNGLIKSVGMCDQVMAWNSEFAPLCLREYYTDGVGNPAIMNAPHPAMMDDTNLTMWYFYNGGIEGYPYAWEESYVYGVQIPQRESAATTTVPRANIGFSTNMTGVTSSGTDLYATAGTGVIKRFPIPTGIGADPTESTVTVPGRTALSRITIDGAYYLWVSEGAKVYRVDRLSGAIERSFDIFGAPTNIWWNEVTNRLIVAKDNVMAEYSIDGSVAYKAITEFNGLYITGNRMGTTNSYYTGSTWGLREQISRMEMQTRTVLSSEVEKTNLTGMKLTYTFEFS